MRKLLSNGLIHSLFFFFIFKSLLSFLMQLTGSGRHGVHGPLAQWHAEVGSPHVNALVLCQCTVGEIALDLIRKTGHVPLLMNVQVWGTMFNFQENTQCLGGAIHFKMEQFKLVLPDKNAIATTLSLSLSLSLSYTHGYKYINMLLIWC